MELPVDRLMVKERFLFLRCARGSCCDVVRNPNLTNTAGMRLPCVPSALQAGQQQPADGSQAPGMKDFWLTRSNDALESFYLVNRCAHKPCTWTGLGTLRGQQSQVQEISAA